MFIWAYQNKEKLQFFKSLISVNMVVQACNLSTWKGEVGESVQGHLFTQQASGQPWLHETIFQRKK